MIWLIDAGHGGLDSDGKYTTDPKTGKLFKHPDFTIYEGVTNRKIAKQLENMLQEVGLSWAKLYDDVLDLKLTTRVNKIKQFAESRPDVFVLSIHSNAGGGRGLELFTSKGYTKSDDYAQMFGKQMVEDFPTIKFRREVADQYDKEADFAMVKNAELAGAHAAILFEWLFFDNLEEAKMLLTEQFQYKAALCMLKVIKQIENCY